MASMSGIPRFLLPRSSAVWRSSPTSKSFSAGTVRHASSKPSKGRAESQRVLEKPTRYNPPSHPARARRPTPRYDGPPLSEAEREAQKQKKYPNMMPEEGTFMFWFLNNRAIHIWITMGTLTSLALFTLVTDFKRTSPFADMLPASEDFLYHPLRSARASVDAYRLHAAHTAAAVQERRRSHAQDVAKRAEYRKAHGLDKETGFGGWTARGDDEALGPAVLTGEALGSGRGSGGGGRDDASPVRAGMETAVATTTTTAATMAMVAGNEGLQGGGEMTEEQQQQQQQQQSARREKKPVKMWFGIW